MRLGVIVIVVAAVTGAGCARPPTGQVPDMDARLDQAEANAFCEKWSALAADPSGPAALAQAALAFDVPRAVADRARCVPKGSLRDLGHAAAARATKQLPDSPLAWRLLASYQWRQSHDPMAATRSACEAAKVGPRDPDAQELCGDFLARAGSAAEAVRYWKAAFDASVDREQQFELISKIQATSPQPSADLAALPPEIVEQYRAAQRQQRPRSPHALE